MLGSQFTNPPRPLVRGLACLTVPEMDKLCWLLLILLGAILSPGAAAESDAPEPRRVKLSYTPQLESVVGRRMLGHLIECALEADVVATAEVAGEAFGFPGSLGLAPHWLERTASEIEQRWVSACILARINYYGLRVPISLRAPELGLDSLKPSEKEREKFAIHEGGFFGNLFAPAPVAYVCDGTRSDSERRNPELRKRVCAALSSDPELADQGVSRCGFRLVGVCEQRTVFEVEGKAYREVIHVYLAPVGAD